MFKYDIDFDSDLSDDDRFSVVVDQTWKNGQLVNTGPVSYTHLTPSQDQTLHLKCSRTNPLMLKNAKSAQLHYSLYVSTSLLMPMNTFELMVFIERLLWTIIHY